MLISERSSRLRCLNVIHDDMKVFRGASGPQHSVVVVRDSPHLLGEYLIVFFHSWVIYPRVDTCPPLPSTLSLGDISRLS